MPARGHPFLAHVGSQRAGMWHAMGRPEIVKMNADQSVGEEACSDCKLFWVMVGWIPASVPIGQGPCTFKRAARMGLRNPPLCCLCRLPIHRKPTCQSSCPPMPAQRCQGTRRGEASWQFNGKPTARPASPSAPHCQLHACGRRASSPSKWPRCQPWALGASWQAGRTGQHTHLSAGAR